MWFKQCRFYQLLESIPYDLEDLEAKALTEEFQSCSPLAPMTIGFVPVIDKENAPLLHAANGFIGMRMRVEERLLPAAVVREAAEARAQEVEDKEGRRVGRKERQMLKDETYLQMLPKAFTHSYYMNAIIDTQNDLLFIDNVSNAKLDLALGLIRKTLGSLKITLPETNRPARLMTKWVLEYEIGEHFVIDESCLLQREKDEKAKVKFTNQDLDAACVKDLINEGHEVTQLVMTYQEQCRFTLKDSLAIGPIQYLEFIDEQRKEYADDERAFQQDADFTLSSQLLRELVSAILALVTEAAHAEKEGAHSEQQAPEFDVVV